MRAFQAANPGSVLEDFVKWYGSPTNPIEEYSEADNIQAMMVLNDDWFDDSINNKLDKAGEAVKILKETRIFWSETWNQAKPLAASDQDPLFDAYSTAEMALDYLETLHPANLLAQVMAVNLSAAHFVLAVSAGEATSIPAVQQSLRTLKERIDSAVQLLSSDTTTGNTATISIPAIAACEVACTAINETEVLLARAVSLLQKVQSGDIVQALLHSPVEIDAKHRPGVLQVIQDEPVVREYLLRGTDMLPSQLAVRQDLQKGTLALAVTKCRTIS
jgi:Rab3 GTPase-activating protein catalytic subunit